MKTEVKSVDKLIERRGFINVLLLGAATWLLSAIVYPIVRFVVPPKAKDLSATTVRAGKVGELEPNAGKIFRFGNSPAILIHTPRGNLKAFTAVCTHLGCTVQYRNDLEHIWCACHNGHFDLNGTNIAGPPPRPLEEYKVAVRGDDIFVSKV